jgi:hypothetical protein
LNVGPDKEHAMSREQLERQADRADNLADQTVDEEVKENLRAAAKEYREKAKQEAGGVSGSAGHPSRHLDTTTVHSTNFCEDTVRRVYALTAPASLKARTAPPERDVTTPLFSLQ